MMKDRKMAVKIESSNMEQLKEELLSVCNRITFYGCECLFLSLDVNTDETYCCGSYLGQQFLITESSILEMFVKFCKLRKVKECTEMSQIKDEVELQTNDVVCISDDENGCSYSDDSKMTGSVMEDIQIIDITEEKEENICYTDGNNVIRKSFSANGSCNINSRRRETNDNTNDENFNILSGSEIEIYKRNNVKVEVLPATSTVNDTDVMAMEDENGDCIVDNRIVMNCISSISDITVEEKIVSEPCENSEKLLKNLKDMSAQSSDEITDDNFLSQVDQSCIRHEQNQNQKQQSEGKVEKQSTRKETTETSIASKEKLTVDVQISETTGEKQGSTREKQNSKSTVEIQTLESLRENQTASTVREKQKQRSTREIQTSEPLGENQMAISGEKQKPESTGEIKTSESLGDNKIADTVGEKQKSGRINTSESSEGNFTQQTENTVHGKVENSERRPFICNVCGKQYIKKTQLKEHANVHDMVKTYKKSTKHVQGPSMKRKSKGIMEHAQDPIVVKSSKGNSDNKFECSFCFRIFHSRGNLKIHLHEHIKKKHCSKNADSDSNSVSYSEMSDSTDISDEEISVKTWRKKFKCNICNSVCRSKYLLLKHLKFVHSLDDDGNTDHDGKKSKDSFSNNSKNATKLKTNKLHSCKENYQLRHYSGNLNKKLESLHRCQQCKKIFLTRYSLTQHSDRVHGKTKRGVSDNKQLNMIKKKLTSKYKPKKPKCFVCGLEFRNDDQLRWHAKKHCGTTPFLCGYCGTLESSKKSLEMHWKIHEEGSKVETFRCRSCSKIFPNIKALERHQKSIHCKNGNVKENLKQNEKNISNVKYECKLCNDVFSSSLLLRVHSRRCTGRKKSDLPLTCKICFKRFLQKRDLNSHLKSHLLKDHTESDGSSDDLTEKEEEKGSKQHQCDVCDATFTSKYFLSKHLKKHEMSNDNVDHREKNESDQGFIPHQCDICGICFLQKKNLESHMKNSDCVKKDKIENHQIEKHTNTKTFNKEKLRSSRKSSASTKFASKFGQKDQHFQCVICGEKSFVTVEQLKEHLSVHETGDDTDGSCGSPRTTKKKEDTETTRMTSCLNIKCSFCDKSFENIKLLNYHLNNHRDEESFQCSVCSKSFYSLSVLRWHHNNHFSNKTYQCDVCHIKVFNEESLKIHKKIHDL